MEKVYIEEFASGSGKVKGQPGLTEKGHRGTFWEDSNVLGHSRLHRSTHLSNQ